MRNPLVLKSKKSSDKEIYDLYAERMFLLCYRYLNNMLDAEEVLHNGFMKVFSNLRKFKEKHENSFEYWIRKIMINECLMFLRKRNNFKLIPFDEAVTIDTGIELNDSFESEDYLKLINDLPVGYRTVFNLFAIEGYKHNEIAEILNISESTSRSQLTKARKLLKQKIIKIGISYA